MIYLCSPYSSDDVATEQLRYEKAAWASAVLMQSGLAVIAPLSISLVAMEQGLKLSHCEFMRIDLELLARCDLLLVLTLDGWRESVGVSMEIAEAKRLGIPIVYIGEELRVELIIPLSTFNSQLSLTPNPSPLIRRESTSCFTFAEP